MRKDRHLLKLIALSPQWSDQRFVAWSQAPLLDLGGDVAAKMDGAVLTSYRALAGTDALPLPFPQGVMELRAKKGTEGAGCWWFHWQEGGPDMFTQVAPNSRPLLTITLGLIHSEPGDAGPQVLPPMTVLVLALPQRRARMLALNDWAKAANPICDVQQLAAWCYLELNIMLAHLYASSEHLVLSRGPAATTPRQLKTLKHKPWLRNDLPEVRLMAGPPQAVLDAMPRGPLSKPRHAPRPHSRRGHWRQYREGKRVFVRASWVGPEQWTMGGRTYHLMMPGGAAVGGGGVGSA